MSYTKEQIIAEIQRVAKLLGKQTLPSREFAHNGKIKLKLVENVFGSWNRAIEAANLDPLSRQEKISDEELMQEIIRLTKELGKAPSEREMIAFGKFSAKPYCNNWGTYTKGREAAYQKLGFPDLGEVVAKLPSKQPIVSQQPKIIPETIKPKDSQKRKKVQYGEPINFRGLRHAPINEQGVVYLFGMLSKELGFLIESIRTEYPDCQGKKCSDNKANRWEDVLIEFEYKSSNFKQHGHPLDGCDLIVCWIHDWAECPIEVLELQSTITKL